MATPQKLEETKPSISLILRDVEDTRVQRTRKHHLSDILFISLCAVICGCESFEDMAEFGNAKEEWFRQYLELPNAIPSHDTFNRVYQLLDPLVVQDCLIRWTQGVREKTPVEIVALDGKAQRRGRNKNENLHDIVNAWAGENRLLQGQYKVGEQSNELTAIPELLRILELRGWIDWFEEKAEWEGLRSVGMVQTITEQNGKTTEEERYYLCSIGLDVKLFAKAARGHWGVENCRHWVLDGIFKEDESRARSGHAAQNLGTTRGLAINLVRRESTNRRGTKGQGKRAGWDNKYLEKILTK